MPWKPASNCHLAPLQENPQKISLTGDLQYMLQVLVQVPNVASVQCVQVLVNHYRGWGGRQEAETAWWIWGKDDVTTQSEREQYWWHQCKLISSPPSQPWSSDPGPCGLAPMIQLAQVWVDTVNRCGLTLVQENIVPITLRRPPGPMFPWNTAHPTWVQFQHHVNSYIRLSCEYNYGSHWVNELRYVRDFMLLSDVMELSVFFLSP